mgnify:CR=1 FL=1
MKTFSLKREKSFCNNLKAFQGSNKKKSRKDKREENSFSLLLQLIFTSFSRLFLLIVFIVKPIAVHITTREKFVSAEKRYDVECKSSGSRPEASLTWWKGSRQIKRMAKNVCSSYSFTSKNLLFLISNFYSFQKPVIKHSACSHLFRW